MSTLCAFIVPIESLSLCFTRKTNWFLSSFGLNMLPRFLSYFNEGYIYINAFQTNLLTMFSLVFPNDAFLEGEFWDGA